MMKKTFILSVAILLALSSFQLEANRMAGTPRRGTPAEPALVKGLAGDAQCRHWVDSVMSTLSLRDRVCQLFIYTIEPSLAKHNRDLLHKVVKDYKVGGLLYSKGEVHSQALLTNEAQQLADVPLLITLDGEWGLSMRLKDTPRFPKNEVLGRLQNDSLLYEYGREVARQCHEMGIQVNFAPVADVNINPKNPVINVRSFGADPQNVSRKVIAYSRGLEDGGVVAVCKHFPGHGDTETDSHKALPLLNFTRQRLDSIELYPFKQAIEAGISGIMVGHLEVPALEPAAGVPSSLSRRVVKGLLADELGFNGLIFTDALVMKGVGAVGNVCLRALKAGNDLLLVPRRIKEEVDAIMQALKSGELSEKEIDAKCRKVLTYKYALGLQHKPHIHLSGLEKRLNTPYAAELIGRLKREAAAEVRAVPDDYGMSTRLLGNIDSIALEGLKEGAYPGCQVLVMKNGRELYNRAFGASASKPNAVYDLASLTKTTATLLAVMKLYDQGKLSLTDTVGGYLPWLKGTDKERITIRQLLLHESGLPSTILFYTEAIDSCSYRGSLYKGKKDATHTVQLGRTTWCNPNFKFRDGLTSPVRTATHTMQVCENLWLSADFKSEYLQQIADARLRDRRYRYSCVGFIVLQQVVEAIAKMPMDRFLDQEFYRPMGLKHTGFLPLRFADKQEIIPSNHDGFLRKATLQGFVHDESAAFQGGVSGNAGLFSTAREVALICQMLLNGGELNGHRYLSPSTVKRFTTETSRLGRRGLGFDKPDVRNPQKSPCCVDAPASVYGHTGFTGTCAWVDPERKLIYVFLSNRTYPNVYNTKMMKLDIRTRIQEAMYKACISN